MLREFSSVVWKMLRVSPWRWRLSVPLMFVLSSELRWLSASRRTCRYVSSCCCRCARWLFLVWSILEVLRRGLRWTCFFRSSSPSEVLSGCSMWPGSSSWWSWLGPTVRGCLTGGTFVPIHLMCTINRSGVNVDRRHVVWLHRWYSHVPRWPGMVGCIISVTLRILWFRWWRGVQNMLVVLGVHVALDEFVVLILDGVYPPCVGCRR